MLTTIISLIALCTALTQADSIVASKGIAISGVARSARSPIQIDGVAAQIVAGTFHPQAGDRVEIPLPISAEKSAEKTAFGQKSSQTKMESLIPLRSRVAISCSHLKAPQIKSCSWKPPVTAWFTSMVRIWAIHTQLDINAFHSK